MGLLSLLQWLLGCLCGWRRRAPHAEGLGKPRYRDEEQQQDEDTSSEVSSSGSSDGGSGASPTGAPTACRSRPTLLSSDRWRRRPLLPTVGEGAGGASAAASAPAAADGGGGSCRVDIGKLERDSLRDGHVESSQEAAEVRERGARRSRSAPMKLRNVGSLQQQLQQYEASLEGEGGTARGEPDLGADMAALCRSASGGGGGGGSARASRHRPRAALPGRWLQSSDVRQHALELGIDVVARPRDAELLWIAEEALTAAEPQGWSREKACDLDGHEVTVFEHWASGEQLTEHPVRAYYKELVRRTRRDRRRGYHTSAAAGIGGGSGPPPPGTLKVARARAVQADLQGELAAAVRWLGWGETSNVCEILLNAVRPRIPRALRAEVTVRLGAPPHCVPRSDMELGLTQEGRPLYALSAFRHLGGLSTSGLKASPGGGKHMVNQPSKCATPSHVTGHYTVRLEPHDGQVAGAEESAFCGKLLCGLAQSDGSQFVFCDDPANFYGWPRELGAVVVRGGERGHVHVLLPRVTLGGAAAQFRVLRPQDGMLAKFRRGEDVQHMMSLQGHLMRHVETTKCKATTEVTSWSLQLFSETHGCVVFACRWRDACSASAAPAAAAAAAAASASPRSASHEGAPTPPPPPAAAAATVISDLGPAVDMSFAHPLSPYQAGCLALSISHHLQFEMHRPGRARASP